MTTERYERRLVRVQAFLRCRNSDYPLAQVEWAALGGTHTKTGCRIATFTRRGPSSPLPRYIGAEFLAEPVHVAELFTRQARGQLLLNRFFLSPIPFPYSTYSDPTTFPPMTNMMTENLSRAFTHSLEEEQIADADLGAECMVMDDETLYDVYASAP
jgi:hypothetical protein